MELYEGIVQLCNGENEVVVGPKHLSLESSLQKLQNRRHEIKARAFGKLREHSKLSHMVTPKSKGSIVSDFKTSAIDEHLISQEVVAKMREQVSRSNGKGRGKSYFEKLMLVPIDWSL